MIKDIIIHILRRTRPPLQRLLIIKGLPIRLYDRVEGRDGRIPRMGEGL